MEKSELKFWYQDVEFYGFDENGKIYWNDPTHNNFHQIKNRILMLLGEEEDDTTPKKEIKANIEPYYYSNDLVIYKPPYAEFGCYWYFMLRRGSSTELIQLEVYDEKYNDVHIRAEEYSRLTKLEEAMFLHKEACDYILENCSVFNEK